MSFCHTAPKAQRARRAHSLVGALCAILCWPRLIAVALSAPLLSFGQTGGPAAPPAKTAVNPEIVCHFVDLSRAEASGRAAEVAGKFAGLGQDVTVKALDDKSIFACTTSASIDQLIAAVTKIGGVAVPSKKDPPETHDARLFFNRRASLLAPILTKLYPSIEVTAMGDDLLIFKSIDRADDVKIHELKRWIALIDSPRPEVAVNAWSVQASSSDPDKIRDISQTLRRTVADYNLELKRSIGRAWMALNSKRLPPQVYADHYFADYILNTYQADATTYQNISSHPGSSHSCGDPEGYCLGYGPTFTATMQPSLSNLIGVLSASKERERTSEMFVDCLEDKVSCPQHEDDDKLAPPFTSFRAELKRTLGNPTRLALLRTAMADFLFQYKFSLEFPHQFDPFDYARSSQVLDAQLDPLLVAFNQDVIAYLQQLETTIQCEKSKLKGLSFASNGIVTLRLLSGASSEVNATTQSAFPETPPPLVQDFVKNLSSEEDKLPGVLSGNLGSHGAAALTAFLNSGRASTVSLGRNLDLSITPVTLQGASSAELKVHFESKDSDKPQEVKGDGTTVANTTDRVAAHLLDTNIRVESLGLFEISTVINELSRGRKPIPILPPFLELPYVGSLLELPRDPATVRHRSFVILSAALMPTAADLLSSMRFEHDRDKEVSITQVEDSRQEALAEKILRAHKNFLPCIAYEAMNDKEKLAKCVAPGTSTVLAQR
jgi:hypothetical protein